MTEQPRKRKRVRWQPEGEQGKPGATEAEPKLDIEPERGKSTENDERLKADKPPHWG